MIVEEGMMQNEMNFQIIKNIHFFYKSKKFYFVFI